MTYRLQVRESNDQATITVPKSLREAKDWDNGEKLEWNINSDGELVLSKE